MGTETTTITPGSLANANGNYGLSVTGTTTFAAANNGTFLINGNGTANGLLTMSGGFNLGGFTDTLTFNSGVGSGTNSASISGGLSGGPAPGPGRQRPGHGRLFDRNE